MAYQFADKLALVTRGLAYTVDSVSSGDFPNEEDVREGTSYGDGAYEGTLDLPLEENVVNGISYDNETKTGTYIYIEAPLPPTPRFTKETINLNSSVTTTITLDSRLK